MKAFLMFKNRDFDMEQKLPWNEHILVQDMELETLLNSMARGDDFLFGVVKKAVLLSINDQDTILYRQNILKDCLKNPSVIRAMYDITVESIENEKKVYWGFLRDYPHAILDRSVEVMKMFMDMLKKLKNIADKHACEFESEGFRAFFNMIIEELNDQYFSDVQDHLTELKFKNGALISAELGEGNEGTNYILRKQQNEKQNWIKRIFSKKQPAFTYYIPDRDESGFIALGELKDKGLNLAANALAQSSDHILSFFNMLRIELAFYIGCLNLYEELTKNGEPISFPVPLCSSERKHVFKGLYDVCLSLTLGRKVVGNDGNAVNKELIIITGANQGGKSTFLRSIGLAQLMMQCGMFVPAEYFCANICEGLFTHFKREEDTAMKSGKLDEELSRMSDIIDNIKTNSMILFNESFAATNEREGSEIARQITCALLEKHIMIYHVTHMYEFAHGFYDKKIANALFLRAERQSNGSRTFRIIEGEPLQTSFGEDLYKKIFGDAL